MGRWFLFGSALAVASANGYGLSLEQSQGKVTLGRPLDVVIPVSLSAPDAGPDVCAVVSVAFGESTVAPHQVQLTRQPDEANSLSLRQRLRVQTTVPVNEPYVSVELRAGCVGHQTRVYTLLADMPVAPQAADASAFDAGKAQVMQVRPPQIPVPQIPVPKTAPPPIVAVNGSAGSPSAAQAGRVSDTAGTQPVKNRATVRAKRDPKPGPILKLDPIDLAEDVASWMPRLALAMDMPDPGEAVTPELEAKRNQARQLWALLSEPEQVGASATAQVAALQAQLASARAELQTATQAQETQTILLEQERDSRYANPVFVGLSLALLAALGFLGVTLRGRRQGSSAANEWWKSARLVEEPFRQLVERRKAAKARKAELAERGGATSTLDVGLDSLFPPDAYQRSQHSTHGDYNPPTTRPGNSAFLPSILPGVSTSFLAEELFDLQQQVEFFISLGQSEQAVEVLLTHLSDGHEPSPLAYLDLLKLYHQMGLRDKYQSLMAEFNEHFNAAAPSFDNYSHSRRGLERYEKALTRIQSLWPSPAVLQLIETSLFRQVGVHAEEMFDLEAYRELLLLYGVAREIIADQPDEPAPLPAGADSIAGKRDAATPSLPSDFGVTNLQPLSGQEPAMPPLVPTEAAGDASDFSSVKLDLDLSDDFAVISPVDVAETQQGELGSAEAAAPAGTDSHVLDFDFTDLDERPAMAIKKSGPAG